MNVIDHYKPIKRKVPGGQMVKEKTGIPSLQAERAESIALECDLRPFAAVRR
jgi:hypothetical protein